MKTALVYHTDFKGYEIEHTRKDLHIMCKVFDELIVLSADRTPLKENYSNNRAFKRTNRILDMLKPETKVVLGTDLLTEKAQYVPDMIAYSYDYPELNFTGTYFNEESFFHKRLRLMWNTLNKIKGRKIWIPYTGAWWNELYTLPQIMLLKGKFDKVFMQPNFYQKRFEKERWQAENLSRLCKTMNVGIEFEIDKLALTDNQHYTRAMKYFSIFKDFEDKAFYTGTLSMETIKQKLPKYWNMINKL